MKKIVLSIFPAFLFLSIVAVSCSKDDKKVTPDPVPDPIDSPKGPEPFMPNVGTVDGMLVAIQTKTKMTQAGMSIDVNTEMGLATFYNGSQTMVEGGTVSLNSTNLDKQTNNSYMKTASLGMTPSDLDLDGGASWKVSGSSNVSAITYVHGTDFPSYTGDVPTSITKSSGLSFTFTSSNVDNADSVYVAIITSSKSIIKSYAPNAGTITISANELSSLPNVSNNTAYLEVLPVKIEVRTYSGKKYAFIKEQAVIKNININ